MFWLRLNSFYFNVLMIMLAIAGLTAFIWLQRRRKKIRYRNLFHKLVNQPQPAPEDGVKYPPAAQGIAVKSLEEILAPQIELINRIEMVTETANVFDQRYWPAIERYAQTVHLLPASASYHHEAPGGLLHHGLEVGLYTMQAGEDSLYGKDMGVRKQDGRERWLYACFLAGLCHDLGKAASDVRVTTDTGQTWPAQTTRLMEWAERNKVKKYYVDWEDDRHKVHESFTQAMLGKVLTDEDRDYLGEIDKRLLQEMVMALTPSSGPGAPSMRPYNIRDMLQKADSCSVQEDHKQSRTPADLGIETRTPMARHYTEGMQQLFKDGRWTINQPGGGAWVLGPARDLYLAWPRCGMELYDFLLAAGIPGVPKAPEIIAETLAGRQVILPAPDGGYYWRIKPGDLDGAPLTAVRLEPQWAGHLAGLLPPGLNGLVETYEGRSSSWSYVEAGNGRENSAAQVMALRQGHETRVTYSEATMAADPDRIGEPMPGNPGPEAGKAPQELPIGRLVGPAPAVQPVEAEEAPRDEGWLPIIITVIFHVCLVAAIAGAILMYMKNQVDPEVPYKLALWMMMGNAMDTGLFMRILLLGLMALGITYYFQRSREKVKHEEQKAGEITAEAQEILDRARQETSDTLAEARREGGEIKKAAKAEAAEIRIKAKEEAAQEAEEITRQAEADAAVVMEQAKNKAQEIRDDFWLLLQAKARDMGIPSEELQGLVRVLQKAKEEAAAIMAQAQVKAQEAADEIIARAQEAAEEILEQARAQAQEVLYKARVQAADFLLGQTLTPEREHEQDAQMQAGLRSYQEGGEIVLQPHEPVQVDDLPEGKTSPDGDLDDQGEVADKVAALVERIWGILFGQQEMKKRDLERKGAKSYYGSIWELAVERLMAEGKIVYEPDTMTYRCQSQ